MRLTSVGVTSSGAMRIVTSCGGETNTGNDSASDPTTVVQKVPDLSIDVFHSGTWSEGDVGKTYSLRVDNSNIDVYLRDATISVSGWVGGYDVDRLPGVTVELVPANSDTEVPVAAATTGADGGYTVTGIAPGEYKVYFRADPLR